MGFLMKCDRCGRFIKNVSLKQLKGMTGDDIVCTSCVKVEDACKVRIDKMKRAAEAEFLKVANKFKVQLQGILTSEVKKSLKDDSKPEQPKDIND